MKKIFTLFLSLCLYTLVMSQGKEATFPKAGDVKPVVDGVLDDVWTAVEQHDIIVPFRTETATVGPEGTSYWKAMWADAGIYVIVVVNDDVWSPYSGSGSDYNYDKIEMYFDTNYILEDHLGGQVGTTGNRQIAPNPTLDKLDGEMLSGTVQGATYNYAFKVANPAWNLEMFVPWEAILDKDGNQFDKNGVMGFDVQITDNDDGANARNRVYWSNAGGIDECWNNMDDAGHITLEGVDAAIDIESIVISGAQDITADNGTVQLTAAVVPENHTQIYQWVIVEGGTGVATVSNTGVVKAVKDGTVKVKAQSIDGFVSSNELTINITNQVVTLTEVSYIKDGTFSEGVGTTPSAPWGTGGVIEDGVMTITNPEARTNPWDYTVGQNISVPAELKDVPFVLQFKAWAEAARIFDVDLELIGDNYDRFGDTPDSHSSDGKSQWRFDLTTEPTVYTLQLNNLTRMDARQQKFNLFAGMATPKVYVDDISLVTKTDFDAITSDVATDLSSKSLFVYPNPVGSAKELTVLLKATNLKVVIYNAVGQKMMEKVSTGNTAKFNVSSLAKGMYIVKLSDGTSQKFVK